MGYSLAPTPKGISVSQPGGHPFAPVALLPVADRGRAWFEEGMVAEEIALLITDFLVSKADKHFISTPSRKEEGMWEQCDKISERFVLTKAGISAVRTSIRAEAKERRDLILPVIAALTGVIGTITGLIAVLKK